MSTSPPEPPFLRDARPVRRPIKLNLYRGYEVAAAAAALADSGFLRATASLDCLMVSDSFLMTHLGRPSTRLKEGERALFMDMMTLLVREVAHEASVAFEPGARPYVVADMPDGAARDPETALANAERMRAAGADVVKLEVHHDGVFAIVERFAGRGIRVMTHLGYTPQGGGSARTGASLDAARTLFAQVRAARDAGAESLVLEKVEEPVHRAIADRAEALPTYAIFSGRSASGGQSLNVWDAVFRPGFAARYFPPTATRDAAEFPAAYHPSEIARHVGRLMTLTAMGEFPLSPPSRLGAAEQATLAACEPWRA